MAKSNKNISKGEKNVEAVEGALSKTEQFIETNQNKILLVVGIIVLIIVAYIGYTRFIAEPREQRAQSEIFMAERYFEKDSLKQAIYGDGLNLGFLDVISEYRYTETANLARFYAGISYLKLGQYQNALEYLKRYRTRDQIVGALAYGGIGDAYMELDEKSNALSYYKRAYRHEPNDLTTPIYLFRAAQVKEYSGDYRNALRLYKRIEKEYKDSQEARNIDRYIAKVEAMME